MPHAQLLIYGIYTSASGMLLSEEVPAGSELAAEGESTQAAAQRRSLQTARHPTALPHPALGPSPASGASGARGSTAPGASYATLPGPVMSNPTIPRAAPLLARGEAAFLAGLGVLEAFCCVGHPLLLRRKLPFLPLLLTSVYCACGMVWAWWRLARPYLCAPDLPRTKAE